MLNTCLSSIARVCKLKTESGHLDIIAVIAVS